MQFPKIKKNLNIFLYTILSLTLLIKSQIHLKINNENDNNKTKTNLTNFNFSDKLKIHEGPVTSILKLKNHNKFISGSWDKKIKIFSHEELDKDQTNKNSTKILKEINAHEDYISSLLETSEGFIISGSLDQTAKVWKIEDLIGSNETPKELNTFQGHSDGITSIAEFSNGKIATTSFDKTVKIWDPLHPNQNNTITLEGHDWVTTKAIDLHNGLIATSSWDKTIKFWDPKNAYKLIKTLKAHDDIITDIKEIRENLLLTSSGDKIIKMWNLSNLNFTENENFNENENSILIKNFTGHENKINSLAIIDEDLFASASDDKNIRIWNIKELNETKCQILNEHSHPVLFIGDVNEDFIISGGKDNSIIFWEKGEPTGFALWLLILIILASFILIIAVGLFMKKYFEKKKYSTLASNALNINEAPLI